MKRSRHQSGSEGNGRKRHHRDKGCDGNAMLINMSAVMVYVTRKKGGGGLGYSEG